MSGTKHLVGGDRAWLVIDGTALPKKGKASVGVAPQYAIVVGKIANCRTLVSVTLASSEVPIMLSLRRVFTGKLDERCRTNGQGRRTRTARLHKRVERSRDCEGQVSKVVRDEGTDDRILEIEVRGKQGVGYCKSMPGTVLPYEGIRKRKQLKSTDAVSEKRHAN